jgi:hypothetical protein
MVPLDRLVVAIKAKPKHGTTTEGVFVRVLFSQISSRG